MNQMQKSRRILIDSDAKNEIDDQYAIVRALIAPESNNHGHTVCQYLEIKRYPRLYLRQKLEDIGSRPVTKVGFLCPGGAALSCSCVQEHGTGGRSRSRFLRRAQTE